MFSSIFTKNNNKMLFMYLLFNHKKEKGESEVYLST